MLLYLITDRRELGPDPEALERLVRMIGDASRAGVDLVQIRERDLPARALVELSRSAAAAARGGSARLLVNDRADVAVAAGLDGVHLTTRSMTPDVVRHAAPGRLVGVSTHSTSDVVAAEAAGADFVVCGPVFATPSKTGLGEPLGALRFSAIVRSSRVPVLAIGGVSVETAPVLAGAAGLAGIRLFHDAWRADGVDGLRSLVADLRAAF